MTELAPPTRAAAIVRWLRRNAAVVWLSVLALAGAGVVSIFTMPSGIYPEMTFPRIVVVAKAGQLSPDLVEAQVTRPLEQAVAVVPGVRHVRARTIRGAVELALQLTDDTDPLQAQYACAAAVDHVDLPKGTTTVVQRVLPTAVPVVTYNLSAAPNSQADARRLREVAEHIVRPAIARAPGVGAIDILGGRVREVEVVISPTALAAIHVTPSALAAVIAQADQVVAAGRVFDQHQTLPVVLDAQAADLDQLRQLPIANGPSGPILLGAVASVEDGNEDPDVIVRGPRGEAVAISVARRLGESTPAVVDAVAGAIARVELPADVELMPVYDQAQLVDDSLASVRDAILIGIALSLLVIAVSLRDWRAGLIAALPVPLTLLATFAVMRWVPGMTLNLMSLGGLAIAIGLVVDDAIVVTEGVVRRLEDGHAVERAIELGVGDMFAAVVGTTITTIVVFAPLAFLSGVTGHFLGALAVTLAIAVALSMAMALLLLPVVAGLLRPRGERAERAGEAGEPPAPRDSSPRLAVSHGRIDRAIGWLVSHRVVAVLVVVALIGAGVAARSQIATGFMPQMDEGAFVIDFFLPAGTSLEETDRAATAIDDVLRTVPEVVTFTRRTGSELGPATATMQSRGDIMVRLVPRARRDDIRDVIARVRDQLHGAVPEARFEYTQVLQDVLADLSGNPAPVEIAVLGNDIRVLSDYADAAGDKLEKVPELVDLFNGLDGSTPILRSRVDGTALAHLGLHAGDVGADLDVALAAQQVAQLLLPDRVIDVRVRYPDAIRYSAAALADSLIAYGPRSLPLGQVVAFDRPLSPAVLRRDGLRPAVLMTASTKNGDLGGAEAAVRAALKDLPVPAGALVWMGGQAAPATAARDELIAAGAAAAVLVLLVLLVQLHSLRLSLVVLLGAPLSTVGGLLVPRGDRHSTRRVVADRADHLLVGLVVKNGILLLERSAARARGRRRDPPGSDHRGRGGGGAARNPVLMTTTTRRSPGLAPLAFGIGAGAELQRPLAGSR